LTGLEERSATPFLNGSDCVPINRLLYGPGLSRPRNRDHAKAIARETIQGK